MSENLSQIKKEIIAVLQHPEAADGLYFRNFQNLHEADEREPVSGSEEDVLEALHELISEGHVVMNDDAAEPIFTLKP